jgi:hypothetical protein
MAGTHSGGKKAAKTTRARYGKNFYKINGAKGGNPMLLLKAKRMNKATATNLDANMPSRDGILTSRIEQPANLVRSGVVAHSELNENSVTHNTNQEGEYVPSFQENLQNLSSITITTLENLSS